MNEKKRQKLVFAVFVLAVIWGIYNQPWKHYGGPQAVQPNGIQAPMNNGEVRPVMATLAPASEHADTVQWVNHWTIDPFFRGRPAAAAATTAVQSSPEEEPVLQGTMIAGADRACVIGGQLLKKGDRIGAWRVDTISDDAVSLIRISDGRRLKLQAAETQGTGRR